MSRGIPWRSMPSQLHEALLLLFRNRPTLAPELMRDALHVELPAFTEARIDSGDLTDIKPAEYRADLVVLLLNGVPVYGIIVERSWGATRARSSFGRCMRQACGRDSRYPYRSSW
jgi:hypothetical protein